MGKPEGVVRFFSRIWTFSLYIWAYISKMSTLMQFPSPMTRRSVIVTQRASKHAMGTGWPGGRVSYEYDGAM